VTVVGPRRLVWTDMGDASSGLLRLRPVAFRYKKAYADGSKPLDYGLIAEEVAEVYPDLVVRGADNSNPKSVGCRRLKLASHQNIPAA
jgi:hypothetical protein